MGYDVNAYVRGGSVHFSMHGPERGLAVLVDGRALERYFGATSDADTWLEAYEANFRVIHAVAQLKSVEHRPPIKLNIDDFSEEAIRQLREELNE